MIILQRQRTLCGVLGLGGENINLRNGKQKKQKDFFIRPMLIGLILTFYSLGLYAQSISQWEVIRDEDGIVVKRAQIEGTDLVGLRGEAIILTSVNKVLGVLFDGERQKEWVDRLKFTRVVKQLGEYDFIVHKEFWLPWPLSNREFIYHVKASLEEFPEGENLAEGLKGKGKVFLEMKSLNSEQIKNLENEQIFGTIKDDTNAGLVVRGEMVRGLYILTPLETKNTTRVEIEILSDPKGYIPKWLVNLVQKDWPFKTLGSIRSQVKKKSVLELPLPSVKYQVGGHLNLSQEYSYFRD
jgi:hypothetical protein